MVQRIGKSFGDVVHLTKGVQNLLQNPNAPVVKNPDEYQKMIRKAESSSAKRMNGSCGQFNFVPSTATPGGSLFWKMNIQMPKFDASAEKLNGELLEELQAVHKALRHVRAVFMLFEKNYPRKRVLLPERFYWIDGSASITIEYKIDTEFITLSTLIESLEVFEVADRFCFLASMSLWMFETTKDIKDQLSLIRYNLDTDYILVTPSGLKYFDFTSVTKNQIVPSMIPLGDSPPEACFINALVTHFMRAVRSAGASPTEISKILDGCIQFKSKKITDLKCEFFATEISNVFPGATPTLMLEDYLANMCSKALPLIHQADQKISASSTAGLKVQGEAAVARLDGRVKELEGRVKKYEDILKRILNGDRTLSTRDIQEALAK
eukprot:TRINITY_DN5325_c0_g1_i1.p2 TRINITY_DN5325_c0_g1~~TRINITY_DN5325_c0_g1_i1.p2  ORF type:complete len:380 (+),score=94.03 TRINITY_DN5325_c0_g1_i1:408-1547(+)